MKRKSIIIKRMVTIILILTISTPFVGQTAMADFDNATYINANDILMFVTNRCTFARDLDVIFPYDYGTFYPFVSVEAILDGTAKNSPLFAGGLWLAGNVNSELKFSAAEFATEFWPGPMSGGTFDPNGETDPSYRVFRLSVDSLAGNPNTDYTEWPSAHGAPVDGVGDPVMMGDQMLWSVYNDANPARHFANYGENDPLGIEVQNTVWASNDPGRERVIYLKYKLYNRGSNNITDFHIGFWLDPDLGFTIDDLTGCDTLNDIIFCYNSDNDDVNYGTAPPAVGAKILYGPIVASPGKKAVFDDHYMQDYENMEMTSFVSYVNGTDPQNPTEAYNYLTGLQRFGDPLTNGTKYTFPGNPLTGEGDIETNPGNRHMVGSFGPLNFNPDDSQFVLVKLAVGHGADNMNSLADLLSVLNAPDDIALDVAESGEENLPDKFSLKQNYPNPFNPGTAVRFNLARRSTVTLTVYNILGQEVNQLINREMPAGDHTVSWDGTYADGHPAATGIYLYQLEAGELRETRKMVLLK
jgi:hypothetical protein